MPVGADARAKHTIAVAQSLASDDVTRLLAGSSLWARPEGVSITQTSGQTPEDFPNTKNFSACLFRLKAARMAWRVDPPELQYIYRMRTGV